MEQRKRNSRPAEILSPDEVEALIQATSRRAPTGVRNRALIVLLYRTGLRIAEALALEPKDVSIETRTLVVLHGKGDKRRTVGIDDATVESLKPWLSRRRQLSVGARAPVFCTLAGGRLAQPYIRALLPRLARRAGIEKRVHAHALRHSFACELAREGLPMNVIQQALGHSSLATTGVYLGHIAPMQVIQAMSARSWTPPRGGRAPRRRRRAAGAGPVTPDPTGDGNPGLRGVGDA